MNTFCSQFSRFFARPSRAMDIRNAPSMCVILGRFCRPSGRVSSLKCHAAPGLSVDCQCISHTQHSPYTLSYSILNDQHNTSMTLRVQLANPQSIQSNLQSISSHLQSMSSNLLSMSTLICFKSRQIIDQWKHSLNLLS